MLDIALRKLKDQLLNPFVDLFRNVSPNKITLASGAFGILCAWFAAIKSFNTALLMWLMNRCLDGLDGAVARKFNKVIFFICLNWILMFF
jgi:phosphatidylglycerophosphate synthase